MYNLPRLLYGGQSQDSLAAAGRKSANVSHSASGPKVRKPFKKKTSDNGEFHKKKRISWYLYGISIGFVDIYMGCIDLK